MNQHHQEDRAALVLKAAGVTDAETARYEPLAGGTYNTVVRVTLPDGRQWVVKIPPPSHTPGLSYERGLLRGEAVFYTAAATAGDVPVPEVVHSDFDGTTTPDPYLIMTGRPGSPWHEAAETLPDEERRRLRERLGHLVATLHTVTGPGFGYPAEPLGPLAATWRQAFTAMTDAVLGDAERYQAWLPVPLARIGELFTAASDVLDEVSRPALVHFDLWQGNLLLDGEAGTRTLSGIIDGERMFWGDPVADFVSLALFANIEEDADFLAGYAAGGGSTVFDASVRRRLALYRGYLYLIMLVEVVPRDCPAEERLWARRTVGPQLVAALRELESAVGGRG
ncbi:phosphotransferase family protein [Streptomyces sp. NPDC058391]|uniref:phosphotransferase family protein n=1 Tax=Streptomyces sp. NPDC058391 TaxID=3346476 RepID=UPI003657FDB9